MNKQYWIELGKNNIKYLGEFNDIEWASAVADLFYPIAVPFSLDNIVSILGKARQTVPLAYRDERGIWEYYEYEDESEGS